MHFILLFELLVAMTSAAVINDIGGLYFSHTPKPKEYTDSQNGHDIDGLFTYNSDNFASHLQRSKRDVDQSSSDTYLKSESLPIEIDQIYGEKSPVRETVNSKFDDLDGLYSDSNPDGISYPHDARKRTVRQTSDDIIGKLLKNKNSAQDYDQFQGQMSSILMEPKNGGDSENRLYIYDSQDDDQYPSVSTQHFAYANAFGDVSGAINIEQIRQKNLKAFIEHIQNFNIPKFDAVKFYNDVMEVYHRYDPSPIHIQVKPTFDQRFIDVGSLYRQNGIPRDEMPRPIDIDNLYQYNGNYPVYPSQH